MGNLDSNQRSKQDELLERIGLVTQLNYIDICLNLQTNICK